MLLSQKKAITKENKLGLFRVKPIASLLCSDDQFVFFLKLGKRIKYLLPVDSKAVTEAENAKLEHQYKLKKMKEITHDAGIDINEKEALIYNTGLEAKDLFEVIDEYKSAKIHICNDKSRVETDISNAGKACIYWRDIDAVKYGE